jgi:hypothetical protein
MFVYAVAVGSNPRRIKLPVALDYFGPGQRPFTGRQVATGYKSTLCS